jgi:hypothetical protein
MLEQKNVTFWLNVQTFMVKAHFTLLYTGRCDAVALVFVLLFSYNHRAPGIFRGNCFHPKLV